MNFSLVIPKQSLSLFIRLFRSFLGVKRNIVNMAEVLVHKTSEKILLWMHRNNITGKEIADKRGITRQAWSNKMKDNIFSLGDLLTLKSMGFED